MQNRFGRIAVVVAVSGVASCASFGVVGMDRRTGGDVELQIVGPSMTAWTCRPLRGVDDPTTRLF